MPSKDVERALQALEEAALRTVKVFGTQLSNTLHIMAKTRYYLEDLGFGPLPFCE